ncbi:hypothetical protein [Nocardia sp. CY41]|uniref:hypothetical protein n=1 Tax=Nocardia sp. CY41 TaxID=2608686 RepID=UPI0013587294|nr:hypothetical protein [Nocardia sp. CY41]
MWVGLALHIAARQSMRLYVAEIEKYAPKATKLRWKRLPDAPAALPIYRDGKTRLLVLDLDPSKSATSDAAGRADVARDAARAIALLRQCRARYVVDRSPRGGMHIYVPLAEELSLKGLRRPLKLLEAELPTLDLSPMLHPVQGCITPPGARCRGGGFRELVDISIEDAVEVFTKRSEPGLVARLNALLDPQAYLSTRTDVRDVDASVHTNSQQPAPVAYVPGPTGADRLPASVTTKAPLQGWIRPFCSRGVVPDRRTPAGKTWSPSEARLGVLRAHVARGWSLDDVRATYGDPDWDGFWDGYRTRHDHGRQLSIDWSRAWEYVERWRTPIGAKSSTSEHKTDQSNTGGIEAPQVSLKRKLASAWKWVLLSGRFRGPQLFSALAVASAVAHGMQLTGKPSAALGTRFLSDAAAVCEDTVVTVLRIFRETEGSPVRRLAVWNAPQRTGDEYTLVEPRLDGEIVRAAEWEVMAARLEQIDPVWRDIGLSAWWVYHILTTIESTESTVRPQELAAAARVSSATVSRSTRELAARGLVDYGYGWICRTGRSPRQIPELTAAVDEARDIRIARHRRERAEFWEFLDVIARNFSSREIHAYTTIAEVYADHDAYMAAVAPGALPYLSPPPPTARNETAAIADTDDIEDTDEAALALLSEALGAVRIQV